MVNVIGTNTGHGHVWKRPDGMKARCGGPGMCRECAEDFQRCEQQNAVVTSNLLRAMAKSASARENLIFTTAADITDQNAAIIKLLEDVPGSTALDKVTRLKKWYMEFQNTEK